MNMDKGNMGVFLALRRSYPSFVYRSFSWREDAEGLHLEFEFVMGDHIFRPHALLERRDFLHFDIDASLMDSLVFQIGMIELVSYWKCACPPRVEVACGRLSEPELAFWRKIYWHGLGEFFYTNGIHTTIDQMMQIVCRDEAPVMSLPHHVADAEDNSYLVPIGGGKDSVVTLELLRQAGMQVRPLIMNPRGATVGCAKVAGFSNEQVLVIRRTIDPLLLRLNEQGFLNGHTPFSAMLAFYTLMAAECSGVRNIALSNESSANESTVVGTSVNHQYSKSLEFEDDFRRYVRRDNYFSFLRPLSELQIAMLFSRLRQYHEVFRSCNVGSKTDIWCGHCAKCLFAYIILSPFLSPAELVHIFGRQLLDDETLRHEFHQLTGHAETKPFECVGTIDEVNTALQMAIDRWYSDSRPRLLEGFTPSSAAVDIHRIAHIGNLNPTEYNILEACIAKRD